MKRNLGMVALVGIMLLSTVVTDAQEKKHSFGIGLGTTTSSSTSQFLKFQKGDVFHINYGKVKNNIDLQVIGIYEYALKKDICIGLSPTYRFNRAEIAYYISGGYALGEELTHNLDIPLYLDKRFPIGKESMLLTGCGISSLLNLGATTNYLKQNNLSYYGSLRLGLEMRTKYRFQILLKYRWNINESASYRDLPSKIKEAEKFRVNTFDIGINWFL